MEIPPWLLAFGVLVVAAGIGAYITKSFHGFPEGFRGVEGFDAASQAALRLCEIKFVTCKNPVSRGGEGKTIAACTTDYDACVKKVTNPSGSTTTPAPSAGSSASGTSAPGAQSASNISGSGYTTTIPSADYDAIRRQALTGQTATLTPELEAFLKQVQSAIASETPLPTQSELDAAQGAGVIPSDISGSTYTPHTQVIYPHQTPTQTSTGSTATVPTDAGTDAEKILANAPALASIRSMVRDDVKKSVKDEITNIRNNYELVLVPEN